MAIERLSLLAAISLVDEQRWDGQERSTRYQDFRKSGWYTPQLGESTPVYTTAIKAMFAAYQKVGAGMLEALQSAVARPEAMKPEAYKRTLNARAFDVARYLLPLATNTSLGQIVNARTLETQVSRLLTSEFAEIRNLGERLRKAATEPAWNSQAAASRALANELRASDPVSAALVAEQLLRPVKTAPTLVKYAVASPYAQASHTELAAAAAELMAGRPINPAPVVDLLDDDGPLEVELATSLLYPHCHYSYRQIRDSVAALSAPRRDELVALGIAHRGRHDELPRPFSAGQGFRFDILMDIGGFRDMHRHRRCVQLLQGYTDLHGYETPVCPGQPTLAEAGIEDLYVDCYGCGMACLSRPEGQPGARGGVLRAICSAARDPLSIDVQDGLRRSPVYLGATRRPRRPFQLSQGRMGDVPRRRQAAPLPGSVLPHRRRQPANRSATAITLRMEPPLKRQRQPIATRRRMGEL